MKPQTQIAAAIAVAAFVLLAGCTEPRPRAVDFSGVDATQPGGGFRLTVKVLGARNGTEPLAGAFVGAAEGTTAVAKATTDAQGLAHLVVRSGQTIRVVAKAVGWTTEDSGEIAIGRGSGGSDSHCGAFQIRVNDHGETQQSWCVVTASNESAVTRLSGSQGSVSIVLFEKMVEQKHSVRVDPHVNALVTVLPDSKSWFPQTRPLHDDPDLHRLHILRLSQSTTTLTWRNMLLEQGDFELGVGCGRDAPATRTSTTVPYLGQQTGAVTISKDWTPQATGPWAQCPTFFAGPIVDTVNSPITVEVKAHLVFAGKSLIIPVGEA